MKVLQSWWATLEHCKDMKKIILAITAFLSMMSSICSAQNIFNCEQFKEDTLAWQKIARSEPNSNWERATAESEFFKVDKYGGITCNYIISANISTDIDKIRDLTRLWFQKRLSRNSLVSFDKDKDTFSTFINFSGVGYATSIGSGAYINSPADLCISLKKDSIIFRMNVPHYNIGMCDFLSSKFENKYISECYPFNQRSGHKESFSRAYLNTITICFFELKDYMEYLTKAYLKLNRK